MRSILIPCLCFVQYLLFPAYKLWVRHSLWGRSVPTHPCWLFPGFEESRHLRAGLGIKQSGGGGGGHNLATSQKLIKTNLIIPTSTQRWSEQKQPSKVDRNKSFREVKNRKEIESTQLDSSTTSGPGPFKELQMTNTLPLTPMQMKTSFWKDSVQWMIMP